MKSVFLATHPGLGDHILCNGLYREVARKFEKCIVSSTKNYQKVISTMLADVQNITVLPFGNKIYSEWVSSFMKKSRKEMSHIGLGYFGEDNFLNDSSIRYDENFYLQAGVDFRHRWESFFQPRNYEKEMYVFRKLVGREKKYLFLHEDVARGYLVSRKYLPKNSPVVKPELNKELFTIFDYRLVLERAEEIHCIESSFCAYVESLQENSQDLFAHRYCRPEARVDSRLEFSYRRNWEILSVM
jgi:hypothetical protein